MGIGILVHHRIVSAVKRIECISNRMSYIALRGLWFNVIVFNVRAPSEEKRYYSKYSIYKEL